MTTEILKITQGKTFTKAVRWQTLPFLFANIVGIDQSAPVRIEHDSAVDIPNGWPVAVVDSGVPQLDAEILKGGKPRVPADKDFRPATVVDATHIEFNPLSGISFDAWVSGGALQWWTPHDLVGYTARMAVKAKVTDTDALVTLTTENGGIAIDADLYTITLSISAADTADFDWTKGVYDLELINPAGDVEAPLSGTVTVSLEVTT